MKTPELSQADFAAFVNTQTSATLHRLLDDKPESLIPILTILTEDIHEQRAVIIAGLCGPFNESEDKATILNFTGRQVYERRMIPLAVALSCEAWMVNHDLPPGVQPRHCADKQEVLMVAAQSHNNLSQLVSIPVRRDAANRMEPAADPNPAIPEGVGRSEFPILEHFFRGFWQAAMENKATRAAENTEL